MAAETLQTLGGFVPAVVTPFDEKGAIMGDAFSDLVGWLIDLGATAICVAGDNGESWAVDAGERARLVEIAVARAAGRVPILGGASAPTLGQSLAYAEAVLGAGASGLLVMPPTQVLKASRKELVRRFESLAGAVGAPIVLYNSPRRAGMELGMDDIAAILDAAPVIGIKESSRDFFHLTHVIDRFADRIAVMVGPCHYIFPGIALGARGFIATGPELLGPVAGKITAMATEKPDRECALLHVRLTRIYETLMGIGTWPSAFKAALNLIGQPAGVPRDPVMPLEPADLERLKRVMDEFGLLQAG